MWSKSGNKGSQFHTAHVDFQMPYPTKLTFKFDCPNSYQYQYVSEDKIKHRCANVHES